MVAALSAPAGIFNVGDDEPIRHCQLHGMLARASAAGACIRGKVLARLGGAKSGAVARSQRISKRLRPSGLTAGRQHSCRMQKPLILAEIDGDGFSTLVSTAPGTEEEHG